MRHQRRWQVPAGIGVLATTMALCAPAFAAPALASGAGRAAAPASSGGPVSATAASGTPHLAKTKAQQTIRQLVQCGTTMYAVGDVWNILQNGKSYRRSNVFSFSAAAPYTMTAWKPAVNGEVRSIAFVNGNCADAYIGGSFTSAGGTAVKNVAEISTRTGAVVPAFGHNANGRVDTLAGYQGHLLAGGEFTQTNGVSRSYFESLSPSTGKVDGFVNLNISGHVRGMAPQVYNQQISHRGTLDLVEGNFTSVAGRPRQQIFMLNLAGSTARVTKWTSPEFSQHCKRVEAFYVRSATWSPGDSTIYLADTGDHPLNWKKGDFPLHGLCDAVAAFPATQTSVTHKWVEYSGCDSYYSVAADGGAVYAAGHPRWAGNPDGCNRRGRGAVPDRGLQGLNPANGTVETSGGKAVYSMSRANADSMLITHAGLWIASSNRFGSSWCDGRSGHAGICFLHYP